MADNTIVKAIADRLKALRTNKGLTMAKLADLSGITRSMISQIEKGDALPSLQTLGRVANALDVSLNAFFESSDSEVNEDEFIIRAHNQRKLTLPGRNIIYRILSPSLDKPMEFVMLEIVQGETEPPFKHEGVEYFYVVEGEINMTIGNMTYVLNKGDSGCFDSSIEHYVSNKSDRPAKLLVLSPSIPNLTNHEEE